MQFGIPFSKVAGYQKKNLVDLLKRLDEIWALWRGLWQH